mgnify:CR=1 FL=1
MWWIVAGVALVVLLVVLLVGLVVFQRLSGFHHDGRRYRFAKRK